MKILNFVDEFRGYENLLKFCAKGYDTKDLTVIIKYVKSPFKHNSKLLSGDCNYEEKCWAMKQDSNTVVRIENRYFVVNYPYIIIRVNPYKDFPCISSDEDNCWKNYMFKSFIESVVLVFLHEFKHYLDLKHGIGMHSSFAREWYADEWAMAKYKGIDIYNPRRNKKIKVSDWVLKFVA